MTAHHEFDMLAAAAANVRTEWRVDFWDGDKWSPVGDAWDTYDAAYDDYAESHKYWPHDDLMVWAFDSDGCATDATREFEHDLATTCEQRGLKNWGVV